MSENIKQYYCEVCDYYARDAYNMRKHVDTRKHLQMCNVAGTTTDKAVKAPTTASDTDAAPYMCDMCDATYKYRQSLWRHKQVHMREPH